jgi:hypothetical protein
MDEFQEKDEEGLRKLWILTSTNQQYSSGPSDRTNRLTNVTESDRNTLAYRSSKDSKRMRFKLSSLLVCAFLVQSIFAAPQHPRKRTSRVIWEYVCETDGKYWFRDTRSTRRSRERTIVSWYKQLSAAGTLGEIEIDASRGSNGRVKWTANLDSGGYTLFLWESRCETGQVRTLQEASYFGGKVVSSVSLKSPQWIYPPPDSVGESIMKATCKSK